MTLFTLGKKMMVKNAHIQNRIQQHQLSLSTIHLSTKIWILELVNADPFE